MTIIRQKKWLPSMMIRSAGFAIVYLLINLKLSVQIERLPEEIEAKLRTYKVIPDLLEDPPNETIAVKYIGGFSLDLGEELVPKDLKEEPHHLRFDAEDNKFYSFIFIDLDVPSRANPSERAYLHWMKVNLNGTDVRDCRIRGEVLAEYVPPNPKNGTGFHRFIYLAYQHPQGKSLAFDEPYLHKSNAPDNSLLIKYLDVRKVPKTDTFFGLDNFFTHIYMDRNIMISLTSYGSEYRLKNSPADNPQRYQFSASRFAKKYSFGHPIATNFFIAEWKPYYDHDEKISY